MQEKFVKFFTSVLADPKTRLSNFLEGASLFEFPPRDARGKIAGNPSARHAPGQFSLEFLKKTMPEDEPGKRLASRRRVHFIPLIL
jgi:hypothetical protein